MTKQAVFLFLALAWTIYGLTNLYVGFGRLLEQLGIAGDSLYTATCLPTLFIYFMVLYVFFREARGA